MPNQQSPDSKLACQLPGYILAGGRSSRFPGDKALQLIYGQPQLQRLIQMLSVSCCSVRVVADRAERYESLEVACLTDHYKNCGPVGGLATALADRLAALGEGWLLLVNCDQITWDARWLNCFSQLLSNATNDFCAALWQDSGLSPLPGLFHTRALPSVEKACQLGQLAFRGLIGQTDFATYFASELSRHPRQFSFNTPDELKQLLSQLEPDARSM